MHLDRMLDGGAHARVWGSGMRKSRKPHPIVLVVENAATELNDLLNAVGLRIALLRSQADASSNEAELARLAGLIEKASQRVQRLQAYTRAEELVAVMRRNRSKKMAGTSSVDSPAFLTEEKQRTALLITDASFDNSAIRDCLERSGCSVVEAKSSVDGLRMLQANSDFDHIVCDSSFLAESGWKFTTELSRAAPDSRVYVLHRPRLPDRVGKPAE
jgi:PleD family two-component response regulator